MVEQGRGASTEGQEGATEAKMDADADERAG